MSKPLLRRSPARALLVLMCLAIPSLVLLLMARQVLAITCLLVVGLALPPAFRARSWRAFVLAVIKVFLGVVLPLLTFIGGDIVLMPEWKGESRYAWIDCFHAGKLVLWPIALWATAALYAVEVWPVKRRDRYWIVWGFLNGAIISTVCLLHGLFTVRISFRFDLANIWMFFIRSSDPLILWGLLFATYVAVWYVVRTVQLLRATKLWPFTYWIGVLCSVPFWIRSVVASKHEYLRLPDEPPDCFVVTAASRGHASIVGPFTTITRGGRARRANAQLITLWRFEELWRQSAPRSHRFFRRVYNVLGPRAAKLIRSRVAGDVAYILIRPVELLARVVIAFARGRDVT